MNEKLEKYLEENGWVMTCESPLELEHSETGSIATGIAAEIVLDDLDEDMCFEHNEKLKENLEPIETKLKRYEDFVDVDFTQNTKYKIIVPTDKDREELMEAFEMIHNSDIDTDIIVLNQLSHEYLTEDRTGDSRTLNNIIVDEQLYNSLKKL